MLAPPDRCVLHSATSLHPDEKGCVMTFQRLARFLALTSVLLTVSASLPGCGYANLAVEKIQCKSCHGNGLCAVCGGDGLWGIFKCPVCSGEKTCKECSGLGFASQ